MWGLKRKWPVVTAITVGIAAAVVFNLFQKPQPENLAEKKRLEKPGETIAVQKFNDIAPSLQKAFIVVLDETAGMANGQIRHDMNTPFLHNGDMVISLNEAVSSLEADMRIDDNSGVVTVESKGLKAQFIPSVNVVIFNSEHIVMRSKPLIKGGHIFLPVDLVARILNVSCFRNYDNGIAVFRGNKPLTDSDFTLIVSELGLKAKENKQNTALEHFRRLYKDTHDFYSLARDGRLFVSNSYGELEKWLLLDDFSILKEPQIIAHEFSMDTIFIAGKGNDSLNLYSVDDNSVISPIPEKILKNDLIYAMSRLVHLKQQKYSHHDDASASAEIDLLVKVIGGDFQNPEFRSRKNSDVQNGTYDSIINMESFEGIPSNLTKQQWIEFCQKAISGDVLLFRNNSSNSKYGFFNHAALILDVSIERGELHLLHARNVELGVGADLPMDRLTADTLFEEKYWKNYDDVVLCRVLGMTEEIGKKIANYAYTHFKDYQFGYEGIFGANQTTCVDLINDSLKSQGIQLFDDLRNQLMLKSFLDGEAENLILLPDNIAVSNNVQVIELWTKLDTLNSRK